MSKYKYKRSITGRHQQYKRSLSGAHYVHVRSGTYCPKYFDVMWLYNGQKSLLLRILIRNARRNHSPITLSLVHRFRALIMGRVSDGQTRSISWQQTRVQRHSQTQQVRHYSSRRIGPTTFVCRNVARTTDIHTQIAEYLTLCWPCKHTNDAWDDDKAGVFSCTQFRRHRCACRPLKEDCSPPATASSPWCDVFATVACAPVALRCFTT